MTTLDGLTLKELFASGQAIVIDLKETSLASADQGYQKLVADGIEHLARADDLVERLAMFSANELLDDMNPNDLKFLLIPAYLGDLTLKQTQGDRRAILDAAKSYFERFLSTCQDHQLVHKQDLEFYDAAKHMSAQQQREQKIARFKHERAIQEKIKELMQEENEDSQRDLAMAMITEQVLKSVEQLHGIKQEMVMVKEMEAMKEMMKQKGEHFKPDHREKPRWDPQTPLLNKQGQPLRPFVITNKRQQLRDQVFRPGWNLPTMSIEEYLDQEMERGNFISGGGKEPEKKEIDDNDEAALDAETMKQREWDEFKEANPRGWGKLGTLWI
ncbi:hypothetical protein EC973_000773 [Apophysomyces ossiformis]|uniref:Uncharacterized protein n=1 Tax=Apophysomyces ossiformis TaxID=679940 RepID=A0A8H7BKR0_9FUNG|nr:hypothetical protein EC973_000773 [Apophysomyces ossiformis]